MRRLPIFLLIDVSESMVGVNHYKLEEGLQTITTTLRQDPYALETAFLSVIVFAGRARTIVPLTDVATFYPPELPIGGGTSLGVALNHLMDEIDKSVKRSSDNQKGDWKPIIFLLTDGHPTDKVNEAIDRWNKFYSKSASIIAISIGDGADNTLLKKITEEIIIFDHSKPEAFSKLINWVSDSIRSQSRSVNEGKNSKVNLSKNDSEVLFSFDPKHGVTKFGSLDDRFAFFVGRCSVNGLPYIVKYSRHYGQIQTSDLVLKELLSEREFVFETAMNLKQSYFELSDENLEVESISTENLIGQPSCPQCNAVFGMAICGCNKVHCLTGSGRSTCPWCGNTGEYVKTELGQGIDIDRGIG